MELKIDTSNIENNILTDNQWREILRTLKEDYGFTLIEEGTEQTTLCKECAIGGSLTITYMYADGDSKDIFQFTKGVLPPYKYARIVPTHIEQIYGAVRIMEALV